MIMIMITPGLQSEPYPSDLLQMLKIMCSTPEPFAMDAFNGSAVCALPYDKVKRT